MNLISNIRINPNKVTLYGLILLFLMFSPRFLSAQEIQKCRVIILTDVENEPRLLWVCVWGGSNTLAQAFYKIRQTRSEADTKGLTNKLRAYSISDQDDSGIKG